MNLDFITDFGDKLTSTFLDSSYIDVNVVRVLLFLLIFAIVFTSIKKTKLFGEQKGLSVIISLIVSILATWYLSENQILYSIVGYNILGILLIAFLPLLIVLVFVHKANFGPKFRKTILWLFGAVLVYVYFTTEYGFSNAETKTLSLIGGVLLASIIFDKQLHGFFIKKPKQK